MEVKRNMDITSLLMTETFALVVGLSAVILLVIGAMLLNGCDCKKFSSCGE